MSLSVVGCRAQGLDSKRLHYHSFLAFADSERRIHNYVFQSHVFFGCEGGTTVLRLMCVHDYRFVQCEFTIDLQTGSGFFQGKTSPARSNTPSPLQ